MKRWREPNDGHPTSAKLSENNPEVEIPQFGIRQNVMALHIHECKHKHRFQKSIQNLPFCPAIVMSNWENGYYRLLFPADSNVVEFPVAAIVVPPVNEPEPPTTTAATMPARNGAPTVQPATEAGTDAFEDAKELMLFASQPETELMDVVKPEPTNNITSNNTNNTNNANSAIPVAATVKHVDESLDELEKNAIYGLAVYAELVPSADEKEKAATKKEGGRKFESPKSKKESRTNSNLNDLAVLAQLLHPEQNEELDEQEFEGCALDVDANYIFTMEQWMVRVNKFTEHDYNLIASLYKYLLQKGYLQNEMKLFEQGEKGNIIREIKQNNHENGTTFHPKDEATVDFLKCYAWICSTLRLLNIRIMEIMAEIQVLKKKCAYVGQ